jgi:hypothetical protein
LIEVKEAGDCLAHDDELKVTEKGEKIKMQKIAQAKMLLLMVTLLLSTSLAIRVTPAANGSRTEDLIFRFYADVESAYAALKAGDIDLVAQELTFELYADAITDPNICLGPVADWDVYEFDINNNYTATDLNDGRRNPCNYLEFRRGIAFCVDKDMVVDTFCGGFANRVDQKIGYPNRGWRNQSCWYEDGTYPYECNLLEASNYFDAAGFTQGTDANPDYDPGIPGSAEYLRIHPDLGYTMNPLEMCLRSDDTRRLEAGRALCDALRLVGVPVNQIEADSPTLYSKIFDDLDYHVYTGYLGLEKFPPIPLYRHFHSMFWPYSGNYVTGVNFTGDPNYPLLDYYLEQARFAQTYEQAVTFTRLALGYTCYECISIPLFSAYSFWAWSSQLKGVVNAIGVGPVNLYTFMNAYKVDGSEIRVGLVQPPLSMNIIYDDNPILRRINLFCEISSPPYDPSAAQPGWVKHWLEETWIDPDTLMEASKITKSFRSDAYFVEPVTGSQLENVNATHVYASTWYMYQQPNCYWYPSVEGIKTLRIVSPYSVEVYWQSLGFWNLYEGEIPVLSFNMLTKGTLSQTVTDNDLVPDGDGFIGCTEPVFYVLSITGDGSPLTLGTDYDIYYDPDGPYNADVRIISGIYSDIDITYLATDDATGYYPGGLPWEDSTEGAGTHYLTDFAPSVGGYAILKKNPWYPMETPPLGEIDFVKKSNGCFKIDIYDVVLAASAYGSQGCLVPDDNWFPGADLAPDGCCRIDIFDIVTITGKYGQEFDCDP